MKISIAKGLADILDEQILRWGSIREAIPHWLDGIVDRAAHSHDDEFESLYGHCTSFKTTVEVDLTENFVSSAIQVSKKTGLTEDQAATYLIDLIRACIRTSESLGYNY